MGPEPSPMLSPHNQFCWGLIYRFLGEILTLIIALGIIPFLIKGITVPIKLMIPAITVI